MIFKVGYTKSNSALSRWIRWCTRGDASHAYIVFDEVPLVGHIAFEAAWCGWRMTTRARIKGEQREIEIKSVYPEAAYKAACDWLDEYYDYLGLLGEAWVMIGRVLGKKWENPLAAKAHHMFCSEAQIYILQAASSDPFWKTLDPRQIDPTLAEALAEQRCGFTEAYLLAQRDTLKRMGL